MYNGGRVNYSKLSDKELIGKLTARPVDEEAHDYFFNRRCTHFLDYIATNVAGEEGADDILGEFYEFVSQNDWDILHKFRNQNNASLNTYLSTCTLRHFLKKKKKDERESTLSIECEDIADQLELFAADEEDNLPPVWQAFMKLSERDRLLLKILVIDGKSALEAADTIWQYVRTKEKDWRNLPVQRVQNTISMMKHRALFMLMEELRRQMTS